MPAKKIINLLPKDDFEYSLLGKLLAWAVTSGRWIIIITEFIVICAFLSRFYFDTKLANLFDDIKQKQAIVNSAQPFVENFRRIQEKISLVKQAMATTNTPSQFVANIGKSMPATISLESLSYSDDTLTLSGTSISENGLKTFIKELLKKPGFEKIDLQNLSSKEDSASILEFSLSINLPKTEAVVDNTAPPENVPIK